MAITVLDVLYHRKPELRSQESVSMGDFDEAGLPMLGGCEICGASIAASNAAPSVSGFLRCRDGCIGDAGFPDVETFEQWAGEQEVEEEAREKVTLVLAYQCSECRAQYEIQEKGHGGVIGTVSCPRCGTENLPFEWREP